MKVQWKVFFSTGIVISLVLVAGELLVLSTYPVELGFDQYRGYVIFLLSVVISASTLLSIFAWYLSRKQVLELVSVKKERKLQLDRIDSLEGQAERREEFIASFAHELKTPLTAIIGYADMIRSMDMPPKQRFTAAGYIFSEGKRLEALSLKLLELIVVGMQDVEMRDFECGYFIREVAAVSLPSVKDSGLELNIFGDRGQVSLEGDLFKTLMINLVDNARKASKKGQKVDLYGRQEQGGYAFYVRDYGTGMTAEEIDRITEAFYMVDKSRSRAQNGAGIGLALCQKIAEVHGTSLEYKSRPGEGTTVRVFLRQSV